MENRKILERLEGIAKQLDSVQTLMDSLLGKDSPIYIGLYESRCSLEDVKEDIEEYIKDNDDPDYSPCERCSQPIRGCECTDVHPEIDPSGGYGLASHV